jgi:RimK family alpha-L-glutamate ligase
VRRVAIFTDDPGWHGKQLSLAFLARGYETIYVSLAECRIQLQDQALPLYIPGFEEVLPDAVFVRGVPGGSLEEVVLCLDILHALKVIGVPVYNDGYAVERSVDKGMTSFLLQHSKLPTPQTWVLRDRGVALQIAEEQLNRGHQLISKPIFGSQGEGIRRIEKKTDLLWLNHSHGVYYLQKFVDCAGEGYSDWRVFVVHNKVIATMQRRGVHWLNNVARGASCIQKQASIEMANLAIKATAALQMNYAGVDIICRQEGGYQVIEVNSIPAWKGLESVCGIKVAEILVDDLLSLLK